MKIRKIRKLLAGVIAGLLALGWSLAAKAQQGAIEVLWLGQSAMRIKTVTGKVIVVDPFLIKNPKAPEKYKNLDELGKVDLILVTHAHGDHLGDAPELAKKHNAPLWGNSGMNQSLVALGILPADLAPRMNVGGTITPLGPNIKITMVQAVHGSELIWRNPATDKDEVHVGGAPVGFIIELENGFKIYHMGDTALFGDLKLIGDYYRPDLVMIPIGGHFVMNPRDAAYATKQYLKPKFALPMHYGTSPQLTGTPEEYVRALGATKTKVLSIKPGDKVDF